MLFLKISKKPFQILESQSSATTYNLHCAILRFMIGLLFQTPTILPLAQDLPYLTVVRNPKIAHH